MSGTGASWKRYLVIVLLLLYFPFTIKCSKCGTKTRHGSKESRGKNGIRPEPQLLRAAEVLKF